MVDSEWDDMNSKYPSKITENIYQGGYLCSENKEILQNLGITHILVASFGLRQHFPDNFKYLQINCHDNSEQDMSQFFDTVYEFIDGCISNEGKILIHCAAGISRSSTCTCVYLMKKNKWSYDTTFYHHCNGIFSTWSLFLLLLCKAIKPRIVIVRLREKYFIIFEPILWAETLVLTCGLIFIFRELPVCRITR